MLQTPTAPFRRVADVTIVGAGVAGATLALAIKRAVPSAKVDLCDPALDGAPARFRPASLRAIAVAPDAKRLLADLGIWDVIGETAQPIRSMRITDSRVGALPNPTFLRFSRDGDGQADLAHMVLVDRLRMELVTACAQAGVGFRTTRVTGFDDAPHRLDLQSDGGESGSTRLLVAADGARSRLRHRAGIQTLGQAYGQTAITATIAHERAHGGCAVQHFLPSGPLALLPLRDPDGGDRWTSIVWTETDVEARRLVALDDTAFLEALENRIGFELGGLRLVDRPRAHPLELMLARSLTRPRFALAGDAARTIHPLAGQGLNLALRDVSVLSRAVAEKLDLGLDPGAESVLQTYREARRFDAMLMAAATDGLDRLFSNDRMAVRVLRDFGLGLVDRTPAAKRLLMRRAMGAREERA